MKSQKDIDLSAVLVSLLNDSKHLYSSEREFNRDVRFIRKGVETRGQRFLTDDLPNLDRVLLKGLAEGKLFPTGPLTKTGRSSQLPKFLRELWKLVFTRKCVLKENACPGSILAIRQVSTLAKKFVDACTPDRVLAEVNNYALIDEVLREPSTEWTRFCAVDGLHDYRVRFRDALADVNLDGFHHHVSTYYRLLFDHLEHFADRISRSVGAYDPYAESIRIRATRESGFGGKHGPGAVAQGGRYVDKDAFPDWPDYIQRWLPRNGYLSMNTAGWSNYAHGSRLCVVPKDARKPRLIAAEPIELQFLQQGILEYVDRRIQRTWISKVIDLHSQDKSRELVLQASVSGRLATVDLSSASDRLSCWVVERLFRNNAVTLTTIKMARSRRIECDIPGSQWTNIVPRKFASQGSACTFPVQCLFFAATALAAKAMSNPSLTKRAKETYEDVQVFGDDIIIPVAAYNHLRNLLHVLDLRVNEEKSFHKGFFRESCGMDAFRGVCVTPVKPKSLRWGTPNERASLLAAANNLFVKGFWHASREVERLIPKRVMARVQIVGPYVDALGLKSFSGTKLRGAIRFNKRYQRYEVRSIAFNSAKRSGPSDHPSALAAYLRDRPRPTPFTKRYSAVTLEVRLRERSDWVPADAYGVVPER